MATRGATKKFEGRNQPELSERLWWQAGNGKPFPAREGHPATEAESNAHRLEVERLERELNQARVRIRQAEARATAAELALSRLRLRASRSSRPSA